MGHLNVKSIRNKFDAWSLIVKTSVDILMISETKLGNFFPTVQFLPYNFSAPYRLDRNSKGCETLLFIKEVIWWPILRWPICDMYLSSFITCEFCMLAVKTDKFCILPVITGEFRILTK